MKLVQFGAGKIGRSLVGQLFIGAGWDVVFVDILPDLVARLNAAREYAVVVKREGRADERRRIGPFRAVDGRLIGNVVPEVADADLVATSVGMAAFSAVLPFLAAGIAERARRGDPRPLDIIIAENARNADRSFRDSLSAALGPAFPLDERVGIVQASIDKMVPLMREADLAADPLQLFAEDHDSLVVNACAFRGGVPAVKGIVAAADIGAYVDRKLFIHNLGHAATAYFGYAADQGVVLLADALALNGVEAAVRAVMAEGAAAIGAAYPASFSAPELATHVDGLIVRFKNRALGDTVHRVGRDLTRKLDRNDRVVGAMLLCAAHGLPCPSIAAAYRAALRFAAPDEEGRLWEADGRFRAETLPRGLDAVLREVSRLDPADSLDATVIAAVRAAG